MLTQCMVEIAYHKNWWLTLQSAVDLRRCMIQALDGSSSSSSLLQIPHFDRGTLKHCLKGKNVVRDIREFIAKGAEERKGLADMTDEQKVKKETHYCVFGIRL